MQGDVFGFAAGSLGAVSREMLLLAIALVWIALIAQLGARVMAERVKARRQDTPQPVVGQKWPAGVVVPTRPTSNSDQSPEPLSTTVMRYFERLEEACNPEPKTEPVEEHAISSQKDKAAECFRSFKVERIDRTRDEA